MLNNHQAIELVRRGNPVPDIADLPDPELTAAELLSTDRSTEHGTKEAMVTDLQERSQPNPTRAPRWRGPAIAAAVLVLIIGVGALVLAATGGLQSDDAAGVSGDLAVEIVPNADFEADVYTFTATGEAVDEGLFCGSGAWIWLQNETVGGDPMPNSMIAQLVAAGDDFEMVVVNEFECADGSGSIVIEELSTVDVSNPAGSAEPDTVAGTWEVRTGSIEGSQINGGGDVIAEGNFQVSGQQGLRTGTLTND